MPSPTTAADEIEGTPETPFHNFQTGERISLEEAVLRSLNPENPSHAAYWQYDDGSSDDETTESE